MGYCSLPLGGAKLELWMGSADKGLITISVLCRIQWTYHRRYCVCRIRTRTLSKETMIMTAAGVRQMC